MEILKISAIILVCVLLITSLPVYNKNISALISTSVCVMVAVYIIYYTREAILNIRSVVSGYTNTDFTVIYKAMGISLITGFVSDTATDNGNRTLANQMVFAGKISIAVLAMPMFIQVLEIIKRFTE